MCRVPVTDADQDRPQALAVFAVSSALCGAAQNPGELISARAVQGLGAAILVPQPLVIISATLPPQRRGAALGVYNSMF